LSATSRAPTVPVLSPCARSNGSSLALISAIWVCPSLWMSSQVSVVVVAACTAAV
jgi:hypothetical protein